MQLCISTDEGLDLLGAKKDNRIGSGEFWERLGWPAVTRQGTELCEANVSIGDGPICP